MANINSGLLNNFIIRPKNLTQYSALRGVTDFSQIGQFDQFETGYSQLYVLKMPKFIEELARQYEDVNEMASSFKHMLEYEFRGLNGLSNVTSNTFTITDGSNEQQIINDVVRETSQELSASYFERSGSLITKFLTYYLTGIKDPMSKAKNYHGLIKDGILLPSIENEVATMMYIVTDNTYLRIEKAFLLCNCQFTQAEESMYESEKGSIQNKEISLSFRCFPITNEDVDKAAWSLLRRNNGTAYYNQDGKSVANSANWIDASDANTEYDVTGQELQRHNRSEYESYQYNYGIYTSDGTSNMGIAQGIKIPEYNEKIKELITAAETRS